MLVASDTQGTPSRSVSSSGIRRRLRRASLSHAPDRVDSDPQLLACFTPCANTLVRRGDTVLHFRRGERRQV
jgi:hypothetical protein